MIDKNIKEYIRIFESISLSQSEKERIIDFLTERTSDKKELSGKYVVAASAVALLAVGTLLIRRNSKQDFKIM